MQAREWLDAARDQGDIVRLSRWETVNGKHSCTGRGDALIVDDGIAVLLVAISGARETLPGGTLVDYKEFAEFPDESRFQIVGSPASAVL